MSRYRKNSHLLRNRDADTQNRLLGQDIFELERESPSPFADSPSPNANANAHLSPLNVANPFLDAADMEMEDYTVAPIPMTNLPSDLYPNRSTSDNRSADYGASSSTMTSYPAQLHNARGQNRSQPHSQAVTQPRPRLPTTTIKAPAKHQPSSSTRLNHASMNYPLPAISTSYTYSSGSSLATTASPSSSSSSSSASSKSGSTTATTSTAATSTVTSPTSSNTDSLTSVVKRRPSPFPLGPVPPPPPPRRKRNEVKPHIVDIAVETFQLDTQTVSKPKPLTASMRRRNPPRLESYEDEEVMVPTPRPYSLEITPAYARRRRNESESSMAPSVPKSAIQLEREALWKQFEAEQIRSPDFTPTSAKRCSRICQEKSITTTPITTFSTATPTTTITVVPTTTTNSTSTSTTEKSEKPAKKPRRKWWSCFGGGGVESDHEVVVNEKR